jgi:hypothetical protein
LAEDSDAQENSVTAEPEAKGSFEPPDPFGGRFG